MVRLGWLVRKREGLFWWILIPQPSVLGPVFSLLMPNTSLLRDLFEKFVSVAGYCLLFC